MPKSNIIIRIDAKLKNLFINSTENIKTGYSFVLRNLIEDYLNGKKESFDIKLRQDIKEFFDEKERLRLKKKYKEKLFMYYLISNTLKTIYKLSSSHLLNSGEIDINIINKVIDSVVEVYNNYPEDIKNDLKNEMDNLIMLRDENRLLKKLKIMRLLDFKKQIKLIDKK